MLGGRPFVSPLCRDAGRAEFVKGQVHNTMIVIRIEPKSKTQTLTINVNDTTRGHSPSHDNIEAGNGTKKHPAAIT